ncbi:uncharacterized protein BDV14DRAFT_197461 [Aspergillus stella-maris]|uniref:uncharacterized protein n=1 Tax=Aspergillus stella-maris TaxID=1810926 RepID=UPI003CCCE306
MAKDDGKRSYMSDDEAPRPKITRRIPKVLQGEDDVAGVVGSENDVESLSSFELEDATVDPSTSVDAGAIASSAPAQSRVARKTPRNVLKLSSGGQGQSTQHTSFNPGHLIQASETLNGKRTTKEARIV